MQTVRADCERTIEGEIMNAEQEKALREYLQEAIVPLIEQVLIKKLGQAMSFAAEQLIQPKREWQGLTDEQVEDEWERTTGHSIFGGDRSEGRAMHISPDEVIEFSRAIEAKLREKNHG